MYTIYINNTLPPALAVHEIYRDIFGPPMARGAAIRHIFKLVSAMQLVKKLYS